MDWERHLSDDRRPNSSIMGLINSGLHLVKKEVVKATADMATVAYYRADEHIEEARERWQERHGE